MNEASRGGVIKFRNRGIGRGKRRENAYRQMYQACGGYYRIDAEGPRSEGGRVVDDGLGGFEVQTNEFWYIQFSCVSPPTATYLPPADYPSAVTARPAGAAHSAPAFPSTYAPTDEPSAAGAAPPPSDPPPTAYPPPSGYPGP